jgi:hypothetical protein
MTIMHNPDRKQFGELMDQLGITFGKNVDDELRQVYWMALRDQPWEIVQQCANTHTRYGKFFPKPSELRPKDENKPLVRDEREVQARYQFVSETWEQMREADPQKFWRDFRVAYLARLHFRFPVGSDQFKAAERRCNERCDRELGLSHALERGHDPFSDDF